MPSGIAPETMKDPVILRLGIILDMARTYDMTLLHENEKEIYGDTPGRCLDLLNALDSPNFKAVYDPANFVQCGVSPMEAFRILEPFISYVHIKDAMSGSMVNVPAGMGDGKIPELIQSLTDMNYHGFLSLEPHLTAFEGIASLERNTRTRFTGADASEGAAKFHLAAASLLSKRR